MFRNYFKIALRNVARNKIYSFINIAGLSMGLTCAMLIILYVKDEVSYDRFHKNVSYIYRVDRKMTRPGGDISYSGSTGYFQGPRFKAGIPEIENFIRYQQGHRDIKNGTDVQSQEVYYTDPNFLSAFSFPLLNGDSKTALAQPHSAVISEDMAIKYFGTADAIGQIISIKNDDRFEPYTVTAVTKKCPQNSSLKFQLLLPMTVSPNDEQRNDNWFNSFLNTFVILKPGADVIAVEKKMKKVFETDASEAINMIKTTYGVKDIGMAHFLQPLTDIHLNTTINADGSISNISNPVYSYILSAIAVFILLIACVNFINLTVARSMKRAKEIGIRKVIGSNRKQLIIQFLGESFTLCLFAFLLAIFTVQAVLPVFNDLSNKALSLSYLFDAKLITTYIGLFIATGLLAGFYPALVLSNYSPVKTLYSRLNFGGKNYLQKSLIVLQFGIASFLIIATLTIFSQFNFLTNEKLGYDDTNLIAVTVSGWGMSRNDARLVKQELMKHPNILNVSSRNGGLWNIAAQVNGKTSVQFAYETIDDSYVPLLKIPVVQGRNFSKDFPSDSTHSVLVNEAFVKEAGWKDPLGQLVDFSYNNGGKYTVVGVVKNYHYESLSKKIGPQLFTMNPENPFAKTIIKITPGSEATSIQLIEKTFKSVFPLNSFTYTFQDEENLKNYEAEAKWKQIMLFGAIFTIFISCIGLFGLSVLSAEKRTKEIGIRKVLGASTTSVMSILSKQFLSLISVSLSLSIPLAWIAADKWLQNYPYRIALSGWIFAEAALFVLLIALLTVSFQAVKAAMANPVKSLRLE
jgi:putative ABC transport system permease protein